MTMVSTNGGPLGEVNVYRGGRFTVGRAASALLFADCESGRACEVPWNGSGQEKFLFDVPGVVMVYNGSELTLVDIAKAKVMAAARAEHVTPYLVSLRLGTQGARKEDGEVEEEEGPAGADTIKLPRHRRLSCLVDPHTVQVLDVDSGASVSVVNHDAMIDWLELNEPATHLLFRDNRHRLMMHDIAAGSTRLLASPASYAQWVPGAAAAAVAQRGPELLAWHHAPADAEAPWVVQLAGAQVQDILATQAGGHVIVADAFGATTTIPLCSPLLGYGRAMMAGEVLRALALLEGIPASQLLGKQGSAAVCRSVDSSLDSLMVGRALPPCVVV